MILSFDDVGKSYGPIRALRGVSFGVDRAEIVAVLGPNGAGKTTALEVAVGLREPDSGSVRLFGAPARNAQVRRRLGVTPQESGFPDELSVGEIASFVAQHYDRPAGIRETLSRFGLANLASRRAGALSGGQARRLAVALAFIGNPELVVLDEPTTGLDVESRRNLWEVVRSQGAARSILFTTHYIEEAQALASRVIVIDHGSILFDGDPQALRARFGSRRIVYTGVPVEPSSIGISAACVRHADGRVTVTTSDSDAYVRAMVRAGIEFRDLEIAQPSLEEAFLAITGGSQS
jgi:ABC-2 type transport system ATP-binding protein